MQTATKTTKKCCGRLDLLKNHVLELLLNSNTPVDANPCAASDRGCTAGHVCSITLPFSRLLRRVFSAPNAAGCARVAPSAFVAHFLPCALRPRARTAVP
jgi:hypothetical protein